jgi:predicted MPP superfamily phosphohydrolase
VRGFAALAAACLGYGFFIEPSWIEVTHYSVSAPVSRRIRIAHVTDLHVRAVGARERKLLRLLDRERPDVIFVTGDSVTDNENYRAVDAVLTELHAPLGVFVTKGNWDRWHPRPPSDPAPNREGLRFLDNRQVEVLPGVGLFGFVDGMNGPSGDPYPPRWKPGEYRIGMIHSPADFDRIAPYFDLVLAGHTHGGQVRFPFLPPLYLPHGSRPYVAGWYARSNARMYVSRGIGNSWLEVRFLCRPELAIIDLEPEVATVH